MPDAYNDLCNEDDKLTESELHDSALKKLNEFLSSRSDHSLVAIKKFATREYEFKTYLLPSLGWVVASGEDVIKSLPRHRDRDRECEEDVWWRHETTFLAPWAAAEPKQPLSACTSGRDIFWSAADVIAYLKKFGHTPSKLQAAVPLRIDYRADSGLFDFIKDMVSRSAGGPSVFAKVKPYLELSGWWFPQDSIMIPYWSRITASTPIAYETLDAFCENIDFFCSENELAVYLKVTVKLFILSIWVLMQC